MALMLVLAGCGATGTTGSPSCDAAIYPADPLMGGEAEATTTGDVEAWALFFLRPDQVPDPAGVAGGPVSVFVNNQIKVVWTITGEGAFAASAVGPTDRIIQSDWEPQAHGGSNWERPGDEWDTGWTFPEPGCWTFEISRGPSTATLRIRVLG